MQILTATRGSSCGLRELSVILGLKKRDLESFRLLRLTLILGKVMELIMLKTFQTMKDKIMAGNRQQGFRKEKS